MKSAKERIDIFGEGGSYGVVRVAAGVVAERLAISSELPDAWEVAVRVSKHLGLPIGRGRGRDDENPFLATLVDSMGGTTSGILWARSLVAAEQELRADVSDQRGITRISVVPVHGTGGLRISIGSGVGGSAHWREEIEMLRGWTQVHSAVDSLRHLARSRPGWSRVELFEMLRYGVGLDHSLASLVLYWEPDPAKVRDRIDDNRLDRELSGVLREILATDGLSGPTDS